MARFQYDSKAFFFVIKNGSDFGNFWLKGVGTLPSWAGKGSPTLRARGHGTLVGLENFGSKFGSKIGILSNEENTIPQNPEICLQTEILLRFHRNWCRNVEFLVSFKSVQ